MKHDRNWHDKLDGLLNTLVEDCGLNYPVNPGVLVDAALKGERPTKRNELAKKEVRRQLSSKLRRWPTPSDQQPLLPGLALPLDGWLRTDAGYVPASKLSTENWRDRAFTLRRRANALLTTVAAIDGMLEEVRTEERA